MSYLPKESQVQKRALKVQSLVIPFQIVGSATPASVVLSNDEPSVLFMNSEGVTQISVAGGALDSGEAVPSFSLAKSDAGGDVNCLVKVGEQIEKICQAQVIIRSSGAAVASYADATPISANGDKLLLNIENLPAFNSAVTVSGCLKVDYIVQE